MNNIWNKLAIWYLDGRTQCQQIIYNYCGLELHWSRSGAGLGNRSRRGMPAAMTTYTIIYWLFVFSIFFSLFVPSPVEWFRDFSPHNIVCNVLARKKTKEKSKHKKRFNFTQSGGIGHRIPLRLPTSTSSAHWLVNNQTRIMLILCIIRVSVRRPYIVIHITCSVTYYIILVVEVTDDTTLCYLLWKQLV